jgi:hypothetical protein
VPYDAALTAIAVATNDALPEHVWRYDTAGGDPVADIAVTLSRAANDFNTTSAMLARILTRIRDHCGQQLDSITNHATVGVHSLDVDAFRLLQQLERLDNQREAMLGTYAVWRRQRPIPCDPHVRHLLVQPYDPSRGMVALAVDEPSLGWLVTPDHQAAQAHGLRSHDEVIGEIRLGDVAWEATAFTHPEHRSTCPHLVYPLPVTDTEDAACRALLRWWALRGSEYWQGGTPAHLTTAEQAALTA